MNKFIDYRSLIFEKKKGKYLFLIANTDQHRKKQYALMEHIGHWTKNRSFFFFFGSFGIEGLENFIIQNDKNIIKKILNGIEKMTRIDKKLMLVNIKFSKDAFKI